MKEATLLEVLRTSPEVKRVLERYFDFIPLPPANSSFFQLSNTVFEQVGRDGSGGQFVLCDAGRFSSRPLLYVSSEGRAGIIGRSLESGLAIIIDLPYWVDCLHFSGGGQLPEMRRVVPLAEEDLVEHKPHIMSSRQTLRMRLGISQLADPVQELHAALTELSPLFPVCAPDGSQYERLGGRFTVMSNGGWRRRLMQQ